MASLKQQAYKGVFWTLLEKISNQGLQFFVGIVLARILTPAEFGLIGMVTVFIALSAVFIDSGFATALINKKNTTSEEESSVFWFNLLISVGVFVILLFLAPYIAIFYNEPVLKDITRVLGFVLIIQAFSTIHLTLLTKELDFKTQFKLTLTSKIVSGTIGIWAAVTGYGVWALVIQRLVQAIWNSIGLWIFLKWRPRFTFSFFALKPLWTYGAKILFANLSNAFFDNIYSLVIGKSFSAADLGYYRRAQGYKMLPITFLTATIGKISFPLYSKVKDDPEKYVQVMRKSLVLMSFVSFPVMAALGVMAKPLIVIMITDKWLPAVPYLQWLCVAGMLYPWHLMNVQSIIGFGRSDLNLRIEVIKNGLRLVNLLIMMQFSVLHIVIGQVVVSILALFINTYYTKKLFGYGMGKQIVDLGRIILAMLLVIGLTSIPLMLNLGMLITIVLQSLIFVTSFAGFNRLLNYNIMKEVFQGLKISIIKEKDKI